MFTHEEVWRGIDRLARHRGLTASGLARRAGLDPTTFNPSKRITKEHKARWPSTESLAKILTATETPFSTFVAMMSDEAKAKVEPPAKRMPCAALEQARQGTLFDEAGFPVGADWDEIDFPNLDDRHAYALEVHGDAMAPTYRDGDLLIVSPGASIRRHDRVLLKPTKGDVVAGLLVRRTAQRVELAPFAQDQETKRFAIGDVRWLARIVWASQ
jgi:phage repressor protein C with HTH and peptisase S24 domain